MFLQIFFSFTKAAHNYSEILISGPCVGYSCYEAVTYGQRIRWDYDCSQTNTAGLATGYDNVMYNLDYLLCAHVGANCSADTDVQHHSHRDTILDFNDIGYAAIGTGYGYNASSTYKHYWYNGYVSFGNS